MRVSIINKDSETVRRVWLWIILGIYLVLLCLFGVFLGLYIRTKSDTSNIEDSTEICNTETQSFAERSKELSKEAIQLENENAVLLAELKNLASENAYLEETIENTTKSVNVTEDKTESFKLSRNICLIAGGISLLGNSYVIPKSVSYLNQYTPLKETVDYIKPRYNMGMEHTLETLLAEAYGKKIVLELVKNFDKVPTKAEFYGWVNGKAKTVTLIYTNENEVIGFVLHPAWDKDKSEIIDPSSYTISFRKNATATIKSNKAAVNVTADLLEIGGGEIAIRSDGNGTAQAEVGFDPEEHKGEDAKDFYVKNGLFTVKGIEIYTWSCY